MTFIVIMKQLNKILSKQQFIFSQLLILAAGLIFVASLYYYLNVRYQPSSNPYSLGLPVTSAPKSLRLDLDQPDDDLLTFSKTIIVSGQTGPNMDVLISSKSEDLIVKSTPDGKFSTIFDLNAGVNEISVVVFDATGDTRSEQRTIYFSEEKI